MVFFNGAVWYASLSFVIPCEHQALSAHDSFFQHSISLFTRAVKVSRSLYRTSQEIIQAHSLHLLRCRCPCLCRRPASFTKLPARVPHRDRCNSAASLQMIEGRFLWIFSCTLKILKGSRHIRLSTVNTCSGSLAALDNSAFQGYRTIRKETMIWADQLCVFTHFS